MEAGVKCVEHGQLLDEASIELLAKKDVWLSLQELDPAPSAAPEMTPVKKQLVVDGTELADRMARKHKVKLAWGTDIMFDPTLAENQSPDILKIEQ